MKRVSKRALAMLCAAMLLLAAIPFTAAVSAATSYVFFENFQSYDDNEIPVGWSSYNADGDGYCWYIQRDYYDETVYISTSSSNLSTDEYLMMPAVEIPAAVDATYSFSCDIRNTYPWGSDTLAVYASASPVTDPTTLTADQLLFSEKLYGGDVEYTTLTGNVDAYRGQTVYFVFHHTASRSYQLELDNVAVIAEEADRFDVEFAKDDNAVTIVPADGTYTAINGQDYSFSVKVNEAYHPENGTVTVTANGEEISAVNGVYTLSAVTEDQEVEVAFAYTAGDVTGDRAVNLSDAVRLFYAVNGLVELNAVCEAAGNIDTYAVCDMRDALALYYYVAGLRDYIDENRNIDLLWNSSYADPANGFKTAASISDAQYYLDRREVKDYSAAATARDGKSIFYRGNKARVVNLSDGYVFTMPFGDFDADYSLSALRSHYESDAFVLNVSEESGNPYGNNQSSWDTYSYEWLTQCVTEDSFLSLNNLSRTHAKVEANTTMLSGYLVWRYDIVIDDAQDIEMPYYSIAIIRESGEYVKFRLFVMKSTTDQAAAMDTIVKSFKEITAVGVSENEEVAFACEPDKNWNDETKAYYEKLLTQDTTDWGVFTESMSDTSSSSRENLTAEYEELSTKLDFEYDIMPTYTHIGWYSTLHYFPSQMAADFAGGNGFNGKPVLQFTYQFTTNNNTSAKTTASPMFDVARGVYDDHFRQLAQDIKAYGKPVLFRLNNEMNTDWTSYCGMVTLLDPDFFAMTWERLYDIFEEEGVDNCIWIFNPIATSTPYCSWGEDLCYLPDLDTVHVLGLTSYEFGNGSSLQSFQSLYSDLYEKNSPYFDHYPHIISEFAAGAGGEKQYDWSKNAYVSTTLGRNADKQEAWVKAMFDCLAKRNEPGYEFCKNIKGAVWFGVNDYVSVDGVNYIGNFLELNDTVSGTIAAFKEGLALHP